MHAYMIIAHNQFELLEKLILALDDERNDIYVHIDAKVKNFDFERFSKIAKYSKVKFIQDRISITWGDFSQVKCEMNLLKFAVDNENPEKPYKYYHLISGVDLPIKSNDEIHRFFRENFGKEFIHYSSNQVEQSSVNRIKYYHFFRKKRNAFYKILAQIVLRAQKLIGVNRLKYTDVKVQKGCNWFSITENLAKYIVANQDKYENIFKHSYCCDEIFIQTIVESSEFKKKLFMPNCDNNHFACARLIDWERGNPYVWRSKDFDEIMASPCMFARKFDADIDSEIIDKILKNR